MATMDNKETKLTLQDFETVKITPTTMYKVTFHEMGGVIKHTKFYRSKEKVRDIIDTPFYDRIEVFLCEVFP